MSGEGRRFSDETLQDFYDEFHVLVDEFRQHVDDERKRQEAVLQGFPQGDAEGHRKYHEAVMRAAEAQELFWSELRLDIAKKGVMGLLVLVCGLVLAGAAAKLGLMVKP